MRVLIAHSFYRLSGGEDRYVRQQVRLLRERHRVHLLARENEALTETATTAARMTYSPAERRAVARSVSRFRPDIIHLHNAYPSFGPAVHLVAQRRGLPLVMTIHNLRLRCPNGLMFTQGAPCRRCEAGNYANALVHDCFPTRSQAAAYATALWTHRFILRLDHRVTLYVAPSQFMRQRLMEWGIPADRIEVLRNFTDLAPGTSEPGVHGLYLGRLSSEKGLDDLLHALAAAGDPPFHFVGDGPAGVELKALAARLGLRNARFVGPVDRRDVERELRGARYVAFLSKWDENAPLAAIEALTAGRPLLVTRTGGLPELVDQGEGLIVDAGDVAAAAEAIRSLMTGDDRCREIGERGLVRAHAEFAPELHRQRLEAIYERAIAFSPLPARRSSASNAAPSEPAGEPDAPTGE